MPTLLKQTETDILLAEHSVHAPGYTVIVSQTTEATVLPDGWSYTPEDVAPEDLIYPWVRPIGSQDAYANGAEVMHVDKRWASQVDANVWEPGVASWREVAPEGENPAWVQPTGAHDAYPMGFLATHVDKLWRSDRDANVWEPGTPDAGWTSTTQTVPPTNTPAWVDTGATVTQLVGSGTYRVSAVIPDLVKTQAIKLGTAETVFQGYWPTATTPSDYLTITPHVTAAVGAKVWKWA